MNEQTMEIPTRMFDTTQSKSSKNKMLYSYEGDQRGQSLIDMSIEMAPMGKSLFHLIKLY